MTPRPANRRGDSFGMDDSGATLQKKVPMLHLKHGHGVNDSLTDHKGARKGYDVCDLSKVRPRAPLTLVTFLNVTLILYLINTEI